MPIFQTSTYQAPPLLKNGHFNTVYAALFRKVKGVQYNRERLELPDGDFLDLDWSGKFRQKSLALVIHGMEGNSDRAYIKGMVRMFNVNGWDSVALNLRGCSGEPNRLPRAYHMGVTDDLNFTIEHLLQSKHYEQIALIGFSLGGNLILKYLGEQGSSIAPEVKQAVTFSVPCHLSGAEAAIGKAENKPYVWRFLSTLNPKMKAKGRLFPDLIRSEDPMPRSLRAFDERFTAPLHGFKNAADYYAQNGSYPFLQYIAIPTLLVNALDDPFLSKECFPYSVAKESKYFYLETPSFGGHVGFTTFGMHDGYWSEHRALDFVLNTC